MGGIYPGLVGAGSTRAENPRCPAASGWQPIRPRRGPAAEEMNREAPQEAEAQNAARAVLANSAINHRISLNGHL